MFDKSGLGFDPEKIAEFFKTNDFTKQFADMKMPEFDTDAVMAAQKKNLDALVEANKAAAAGYQELFKQQIAVFEETMSEAQTQIKAMEAPALDGKAATAQAEVAKAAFAKAISNMQALAETATRANSEAFEIVSSRVKDSVEELKDMAEKFKA